MSDDLLDALQLAAEEQAEREQLDAVIDLPGDEDTDDDQETSE